MSADNQILIQKRRDGRWAVWMGYASDDEQAPGDDAARFDTEAEARAYALGLSAYEMVEYGVCTLPEEERRQDYAAQLAAMKFALGFCISNNNIKPGDSERFVHFLLAGASWRVNADAD